MAAAKPAEKAAAEVSVSLRPTKKKGAVIMVNIPTVLSTRLKVDDKEAETRVQVAWGEEEHEGQLMVRVDPAGEFRLGWFATHLRVSVAAPAVVENLHRDAEKVPHYFEGDALILAMPAWAWQSRHQMNSHATADAGEMPAIKFDGNIIQVADWKGRFSKTEAVIARLFVKQWGKVIPKEKVYDELYADDPNGGADPKIVDVYIYKVRKVLEGSGITLSTHWGVGWALVLDRGQQTKPESAAKKLARQKEPEPPAVAVTVSGDYLLIQGQQVPIRISNSTLMAIFTRFNKDFGQTVTRAELAGKYAEIDRWVISLKAKLDGSKIKLESVSNGWRLVAAS